MAVARWYMAYPKNGGKGVYTPKTEEGKGGVITHKDNKYPSLQHLTTEQARERYTVGDVLDALTGSGVESNYRRLTQLAPTSSNVPSPNGNGKHQPLTGAARDVEGKTVTATV